MKPLQAVAMGSLLMLLQTRIGGFDLYADWAGWLLVLYGVARLPEVPQRGLLTSLALLAGLVSVPLWVPVVARALDDADPALAWAANLPRLGFLLLLCTSLAAAAVEAGDTKAGTWWRTAQAGVLAVVVLPVLVFGAGVDALENVAGAAVVLVPLVVVVLCFAHSSRPWAVTPITESPANPPASS